MDMVEWAEEVANFLTREKTNAQRCLHDCERLLSDPHVKSDSLKEGLRDLMSKTEDNYGTLLHLERVMTMKNHGDNCTRSAEAAAVAISTAAAANIETPRRTAEAPMEVAASAPQYTQTGRFRQQRVTSFDFGETRESPPVNEATEDTFDPLKEELLFSSNSHEGSVEKSDDVDDYDEDSGFPEAEAAAYKTRPLLEKPSVIAKSLPMNVPLQQKFIIGGRSPPDLSEETQDIPTKIAELARSLHVDVYGELPTSPPRYLD